MERPIQYQIKTLFSSRNLLRIIGVGIIGVFVSLIFGISFVLMFIGLFNFVLFVSFISKPVYSFITSIIDPNINSEDFIPPSTQNLSFYLLLFHSLIWLSLFLFGLWHLFSEGFVGQNLIYQMFLSE